MQHFVVFDYWRLDFFETVPGVDLTNRAEQLLALSLSAGKKSRIPRAGETSFCHASILSGRWLIQFEESLPTESLDGICARRNLGFANLVLQSAQCPAQSPFGIEPL